MTNEKDPKEVRERAGGMACFSFVLLFVAAIFCQFRWWWVAGALGLITALFYLAAWDDIRIAKRLERESKE